MIYTNKVPENIHNYMANIEKISSSILPQEYPNFPFVQVPLAKLEKDKT